jgi:hypothetical protein
MFLLVLGNPFVEAILLRKLVAGLTLNVKMQNLWSRWFICRPAPSEVIVGV